MTGDLRDDLRRARRATDVTFAKFAALAGFSVPYLRNVENGTRTVTAEVAAAYDRVCDTGGVFAAAVAGMDAITAQPWNQAGALTALTDLANGEGVDRRSFVAASSGALAGLVGRWRAALVSGEGLTAAGSRQVPAALIGHIDDRLDHLRHLDDGLGSGVIASHARNELVLLVHLLRTGAYADAAGQRLYALAAEASRQAAWALFDQNQHRAARRYFETALRASATAADPVTGAYAMSFMAIQCYSTGQPSDAVSLLEAAQSAVAGKSTPRMTAMLWMRLARSLSKTGDAQRCAHALHQARTALAQGPHPDDPATLYWVTEGEVEMIAGSSALELGNPAEALRRFEASAAANYQGDDAFPRTNAIYLSRAAEAHLALRDLDAAVQAADHAVRCLGGVDSARSASSVSGLRKKFQQHSAVPVVRDFLDATR